MTLRKFALVWLSIASVVALLDEVVIGRLILG